MGYASNIRTQGVSNHVQAHVCLPGRLIHASHLRLRSISWTQFDRIEISSSILWLWWARTGTQRPVSWSPIPEGVASVPNRSCVYTDLSDTGTTNQSRPLPFPLSVISRYALWEETKS